MEVVQSSAAATLHHMHVAALQMAIVAAMVAVRALIIHDDEVGNVGGQSSGFRHRRESRRISPRAQHEGFDKQSLARSLLAKPVHLRQKPTLVLQFSWQFSDSAEKSEFDGGLVYRFSKGMRQRCSQMSVCPIVTLVADPGDQWFVPTPV